MWCLKQCISIFVKAKYQKGSVSNDCGLDKIITEKSECKVAASELGLTGQYSTEVRSVNLPAGCHFNIGTGKAGFNSVIDAGSTSPSSQSFGICKGSRFNVASLSIYCSVSIYSMCLDIRYNKRNWTDFRKRFVPTHWML